MSEEPVMITVCPNGPLRVEGHIVLKDADGKEWDLTGKPAISLCRCGHSEKRPFCDGSHKGTGLAPLQYQASKTQQVWFCGCKQTGGKPFCDGTHSRI